MGRGTTGRCRSCLHRRRGGYRGRARGRSAVGLSGMVFLILRPRDRPRWPPRHRCRHDPSPTCLCRLPHGFCLITFGYTTPRAGIRPREGEVRTIFWTTDSKGLDMADELNGKRIAILVANEGIEQVELDEPRKAVEEAGAETDLIAPESGEVQAFDHLDKADTFPVDVVVADADAGRLRRPGAAGRGAPTPTTCARSPRRSSSSARSSRRASRSGAICHAPVDADRGRGRRGAYAHLVAEPADRPAERRGGVGRRGGRRRRRASSPAASRTTCPPSTRRSSRSSPRACTRSRRRRPRPDPRVRAGGSRW